MAYPNSSAILSNQTTLGSSNKPVYISNGIFYECNQYPTGGSISSVSIGAGTASNTVKVTVNTTSSADYTIPYATSAKKASRL
jgi:hypothetical protein